MIQILGLLGMYFDTLVVEVVAFFRLSLAILWVLECKIYQVFFVKMTRIEL